jgi:hypothetical protein
MCVLCCYAFLLHTHSPVWDEGLMLCWDGKESLHIDVYGSGEHVGHALVDLRYY